MRTDIHRVVQASLRLTLFDPDVPVFKVCAVPHLAQISDTIRNGFAIDGSDVLEQVQPASKGQGSVAIDDTTGPRKRCPESPWLGGMYPDFVQAHLRGALCRSVRAKYRVGIAAFLKPPFG